MRHAGFLSGHRGACVGENLYCGEEYSYPTHPLVLPGANRQGAPKSPGDRNCVLRVYWGSRQGKRSGRFFSLRNFKLHLGQVEILGMDPVPLVHQLAGALATMHWEAGVVARTAGFVIGSVPSSASAFRPLPAATLQYLPPETYAER